MQKDRLAFDKDSMREYDADGRLRVKYSRISKAVVNPYFGEEIPNTEQLGLEPKKIYYLLRDPAELAKAVDTFNNLPVLSKHIPAFVGKDEATWKPFVVGSSGTDCAFDGTYLTNSLVFWDAIAIAGIQSGDQREISCSYRYDPVMTAGEYNGVKYDGIMTNIIGNHIAVVESGRAGSDVLVSDSNPFLERFDMSKTSRVAVAVKAGLGAHLMPVLAADAKIDLKHLVGLPKKATIAADAERIAQAVIVATQGKLAADAKLDAKALAKVIVMAADAESDKEEDEEPKEPKDKDKNYPKEPVAKDEEDDEEKDEKVSKTAMDAAIAAARLEAEKTTIARLNAIRKAEQDVHPLIGAVVAQDSAEAVYKLALDQMKIDTTDVHPSAYRALVAQAVQYRQSGHKPKTANDSAAVDSEANLKAFLGAK